MLTWYLKLENYNFLLFKVNLPAHLHAPFICYYEVYLNNFWTVDFRHIVLVAKVFKIGKKLRYGNLKNQYWLGKFLFFKAFFTVRIMFYKPRSKEFRAFHVNWSTWYNRQNKEHIEVFLLRYKTKITPSSSKKNLFPVI